MDVPRSILQAPADSPDVRSGPGNSNPSLPSNSSLRSLHRELRAAARILAVGRINRRTHWRGNVSRYELFCMECRLTQEAGAGRSHLDWCQTGRVLAILARLDQLDAELPRGNSPTMDGPGVDGYEPIRLHDVDRNAAKDLACDRAVR